LSWFSYNGLQLKEVGDFLPQMFIRRTNVCATTKLSYEALNRQFLVGAVMGLVLLLTQELKKEYGSINLLLFAHILNSFLFLFCLHLY
jgi:hypothetical protein